MLVIVQIAIRVLLSLRVHARVKPQHASKAQVAAAATCYRQHSVSCW